MKRILFSAGQGIGDILFGLAFVDAVRRADPENEYALFSKKKWWLRFLSVEAPFQTFNKWINGWDEIVILSPRMLRPGQRILDAYLEMACARVALPAEVPMPRQIPWFGPPFSRHPRIVGVFASYFGPRRNVWGGSQAFADELCGRGIDAELIPEPQNPYASTVDAIEWLATCRLFVGPDTGLAHVAAALNIPVIMILGGKLDEHVFAEPRVEYITSSTCPLHRSPCRVWKPFPPCLRGKSEEEKKVELPCLRAVSVNDVLARAINALEKEDPCHPTAMATKC